MIQCNPYQATNGIFHGTRKKFHNLYGNIKTPNSQSNLKKNGTEGISLSDFRLYYKATAIQWYADDTTLMAESEEELKSLLMKEKEESGKAGLKLNIQNDDHGIWSHHFMTNRWGNNGNSIRFPFFGSEITVDGDCSHEIKKCLLLGRKTMTNLHSILKSRDSTLLTKVPIIKAIVFPVVLYGCNSWTIKEVEH